MIVYDLNSGHREYPGYDEIEDRRGGGRGRSRRSDDWFIVMAILPTGQVSNHYESKYWDLFDVPERETAFEYDGHTPNEAADRLEKYLKLPRRGMTFEQALERLKLGRKIKRIDWGKKYICMFDVNILMIDTGQKVASNWNPTEHDIMSNDWEIAG